MGISFSRPSVKVDITISDELHRPSSYCGVLFSLWVLQKLCVFPELKTVILLAKRLLASHDLNNLYHGTSL